MPRLAMDYSKTVIYHFVCQDTNIKCSYVGSTTNFVKRKYGHKHRCCNENIKGHNSPVYKTIRDNGGWDNWNMLPLEEFVCESKIQQNIREQYWIDKLQPTMNHLKAYRSEEDLYQYQKDYAEKNKEHLKAYHKEWYKRKHASKIDGDASEPIHSS
jgi:hypothetical protein